MRDSYHQVYDLLWDGSQLEQRKVGQVGGRYTLVGLYLFYLLKDLRQKQTEFW